MSKTEALVNSSGNRQLVASPIFALLQSTQNISVLQRLLNQTRLVHHTQHVSNLGVSVFYLTSAFVFKLKQNTFSETLIQKIYFLENENQ